MRTRTLLVLTGVALAIVGSQILTGPSLPSAAAQQPAGGGGPALTVGRYQVSAFPGGPGHLRGAYIVDTTTGELYVTTAGEKPLLIGPLPKEK